jgi:hypothetical protein
MRRHAAAPRPPRAAPPRLTVAPRLTAPLLVVLVVASCASPVAIHRYAGSAALVTGRVPDVADALSASCHRTASYRLQRTTGWFDADSVDTACAGRDSATRSLARANRALSVYFAALEALADGKVLKLDEQVDALADATREAAGFDRKQVGAVDALARFAATRAADGYRRTRLRDAIASQNENVQTITTAMHDVLERDFARYLANDGQAQSMFYRAALTESSAREPLTAILVRDSFDERETELAERTRAVRALGQAMLTVGRGHQALYDARDHLGGKTLLAAIVANARELDSAMKRVEKAF